MIYCYYDKNGILREIINNESTRQGTSESRAIIKVYYELHNEITSMSATFKVGDYVAQTERFAIGVEESAVPYNSKINYKYFKDNTPYKFFDFEIPSDILEKGANDVSTNVSCTFTPYYEDNAWDKLGLLTFNLQASVLNIDYTLTTSQMDYLLAEISKFEFVKNNGVYGTIDGSVRDGENALSVYPNGSFVLQYVLNTSQLVPATQIKGIRFYRVVANKYSLLYSSVENTDLLLKLEQSDITKTYQINTLLNDVARLKEVFLDFATKEELSEVAFSGNYNDLIDKPTIPTQLSELTNNVGFITNAVSDLVNYYKKTETFTKDEILARLNAIKTIKFEIYASLDNITEPQTNVIYLIGTQSPYKEYAYIEGVGFEIIGSTDIDLSNYVQSDNTLNNDYVVLGNADKKVKTSSYKIETSSLNNSGIPTTNLVQTEIRKYHDIITINGDSGTITNAIDTPYRLIVDENLLVYRRIKNDNNAPIYHSQQVVDNEHIRDYYLVFSGRNYTRSYVENVSHSEFDSLVANTPTEILYNKETKIAQLAHDGQPIGEGAMIDLNGFTPYFDGDMLVLSDLEHAEMDLATKQDKIESVKIVAPSAATQGAFTSAELETLLKGKLNYVEFNNENFYPQDVEIGEGYIIYSHVGMYEGNTKIKSIILTIATGSWVLTEVGLSGSGAIENVAELPTPTETSPTLVRYNGVIFALVNEEE